ncbi:MAG: hypothetical protein K9K32_05110, partial [Halanaerobiales bacterium]|nr:hypothetical protein [Halanaerobiales bacterium]
SKRQKLLLSLIIIVTLTFLLTACDHADNTQHTLTINIEGEGVTSPSEGTIEVSEGLVNISANSIQDSEFYAWTGDDVNSISEVQNSETTIYMDGDKEITAFFCSSTENKQTLDFEVQSFMGAQGEAQDLTGHPPYPPGFEVKIKAEPKDPEKYTFLHWSVEFVNSANSQVSSMTSVDPREYFQNHESAETTFQVPGERVIITPYFTTKNPEVDPGEFNYDYTNFDQIINGEVGKTRHYWDISNLNPGEKIDFYFHARTIPDRFTVYYGNMEDWENRTLEKVFASSWVSYKPERWENPQLYPEGIKLHNWHNDVVFSNWNPNWSYGAGGKYQEIIVKEANKNIVMVEIEGRDDNTIWDYKLTSPQY